ncbi:MAG: hypothetical protein AB8G95_01610 [Anaerolineae bacterium]
MNSFRDKVLFCLIIASPFLIFMGWSSYQSRITQKAKAQVANVLYDDISYEELESEMARIAYARYHCSYSSVSQWSDIYVFGSSYDSLSDNIYVSSRLIDGVRKIESLNQRYFIEDNRYGYDSAFSDCEKTEYLND